MKFVPLNAGDLNQMVTIEAEHREPNGRGGWNPVGWTQVGTAWAQIIPLRGDEALRLGAERQTMLYKVVIRYWPGLTSQHRLVWNGTPMNIRMLGDPYGRSDRWVMTCEVGTGV